ncbi:MAG: MFS transporter [Actinobacteria bacterium]|nr:MFS transporter [Actinomycetota bacterium]
MRRVGPMRAAHAAVTLASNLAGVGAMASAVPAAVRANFRRDLVNAATAGVLNGIAGFWPVVARRVGASELDLALMMSGAFIGSILTLLAPYFLTSDQPARRIAATWVAARLAWGTFLFITTPAPFVAMVLFVSIVGNFALPGYSQLMQGAYPGRMRGRLMAAVRAAMAMLSLVAAPTAGALMDAWGYGPLFAFAAVISALGALAFGGIRVLTPTQPPRPEPLRLIRTAWQNRHFRRYAIAFNTFAMGGVVLAPVLPVVLVDDFQAPYATVGVLSLAQGLAWVAGYMVWGRVADRWSGPRTSWLSTFAQAVVPAATIVALVLGNVWVLLLAWLAIGLDAAGNDLGWQTSITSLGPASETTAYAMTFHLSVGVRGLGGPFLGGALLVATGPIATCLVSLGFALVGNLLMLRAAQRFVPYQGAAD